MPSDFCRWDRRISQLVNNPADRLYTVDLFWPDRCDALGHRELLCQYHTQVRRGTRMRPVWKSVHANVQTRLPAGPDQTTYNRTGGAWFSQADGLSCFAPPGFDASRDDMAPCVSAGTVKTIPVSSMLVEHGGTPFNFTD